MQLHRNFLLVPVAVVLAIACSGPADLDSAKTGGSETAGGGGSGGSGSGGGSGGGGSQMDGGLACSDFAAAKCAKLGACTLGVDPQVTYASTAQCQTREALSCLGALAAPDTTADPDGFEQCGEAITAGTCADFFNGTNVAKPCTALAGPRANGRGCVDDGQCQSAWCYAATGVACGVCATRPAAGAPCAENVDCGGLGLLCSEAKTCATIVLEGGSCDSGNPCGFALSCVGSTATTAGTCQTAGAAAGATCDGARVKAPLCEHDFGLFCPSATDECATASLVSAGAACGVFAGDAGAPNDAGVRVAGPSTMAMCAGGSACEPSTADKGTCVAAAGDGEACDAVNGPPCLDPARCIVAAGDGGTAGTCAVLALATCN